MNNSVEPMEYGTAADDTDARGFFSRSKNLIVEGVIAGTHESEDYSMKTPVTGKCLIFNNKDFEKYTNMNTRNGTDVDAARLYCRFKDLNFDVQLFQDYTVKKVEEELNKAGKADYTDVSCFVCCVLSHGEQGILFARDGKYQTEQVFERFRGDVCPSLAGKPKMFFIQACQGDKVDCGVNVTCRESSDSDDAASRRIPVHADFLIVYSTVPGFYSWRNTTNGSWFAQALCMVLQKHAHEKDLLSLLTIVNRRVAYDYESYTPQDSSMHMKKQVPCITSTLTRNVKFPVRK